MPRHAPRYPNLQRPAPGDYLLADDLVAEPGSHLGSRTRRESIHRYVVEVYALLIANNLGLNAGPGRLPARFNLAAPGYVILSDFDGDEIGDLDVNAFGSEAIYAPVYQARSDVSAGCWVDTPWVEWDGSPDVSHMRW